MTFNKSKILGLGILLAGSTSFGAAIVPAVEDSKQASTFACLCNKAVAFPTSLALSAHIVEHHLDDGKWVDSKLCGTCNVTYRNSSDAKAHYYEWHFKKPNEKQVPYLAKLRELRKERLKREELELMLSMGQQSRGIKRPAPALADYSDIVSV